MIEEILSNRQMDIFKKIIETSGRILMLYKYLLIDGPSTRVINEIKNLKHFEDFLYKEWGLSPTKANVISSELISEDLDYLIDYPIDLRHYAISSIEGKGNLLMNLRIVSRLRDYVIVNMGKNDFVLNSAEVIIEDLSHAFIFFLDEKIGHFDDDKSKILYNLKKCRYNLSYIDKYVEDELLSNKFGLKKDFNCSVTLLSAFIKNDFVDKMTFNGENIIVDNIKRMWCSNDKFNDPNKEAEVILHGIYLRAGALLLLDDDILKERIDNCKMIVQSALNKDKDNFTKASAYIFDSLDECLCKNPKIKYLSFLPNIIE